LRLNAFSDLPRDLARDIMKELKVKSIEATTTLIKQEELDSEIERLHKDMMPYAVVIASEVGTTKTVTLQILKTHPARSMCWGFLLFLFMFLSLFICLFLCFFVSLFLFCGSLMLRVSRYVLEGRHCADCE
jgi:hypothetical protein